MSDLTSSLTDRLAQIRERMERERILWMATTRPDGRPHVAPIWYIWHADRGYVMTGGVKVENVRHNGLAALNTESGAQVVIVEGTARIVAKTEPLFDDLAKRFDERYSWNIRGEGDNQQLIEVSPVKVLTWNA